MKNKIFDSVVYTEKKKETKRRLGTQIKMKEISIIKILFRNFMVKETYLGKPRFPQGAVWTPPVC